MKPFEIAYKVFPDGLGGYSYSAMLNIQLALPEGISPRTKRVEVVIDSGATRCLFHSDFAVHLGIDEKKCDREKTMGIGGQENTFLYDVTLYIPGGPVNAKVGFKENLPVAGLLGMNGFFEHFRIVFDGPGAFCSLERIYRT